MAKSLVSHDPRSFDTYTITKKKRQILSSQDTLRACLVCLSDCSLNATVISMSATSRKKKKKKKKKI